ncbi:hypothetical protein TNCV_1240591 [Trichonephila clavipes]|uniref:Transposase n=1 Tax=Trichonephila clavipes TaxID=2585209 RepID=A0A8X6WE36_TRICX|nr:hypothetical protein TNCV_1240591 [Trichonephila clavipes]
MSVARRLGLGCSRQTNTREDRHIIQHSRITPTVSLFSIQTQTAPSLRASVSIRTIIRRLVEEQLLSLRSSRVLPFEPTQHRFCLEWYHTWWD